MRSRASRQCSTELENPFAVSEYSLSEEDARASRTRCGSQAQAAPPAPGRPDARRDPACGRTGLRRARLQASPHGRHRARSRASRRRPSTLISPSKDAMLEELLRKVHGEFRQPFRSPVPPRMAFRERVTLVVHEMLERAQKWSHLFEVFLAFEGHAGGERNHLAQPRRVPGGRRRVVRARRLTATSSPAATRQRSRLHRGSAAPSSSAGWRPAPRIRLSDTTAPILEYFFHGPCGCAPAKPRRSRKRSLRPGSRSPPETSSSATAAAWIVAAMRTASCTWSSVTCRPPARPSRAPRCTSRAAVDQRLTASE